MSTRNYSKNRREEKHTEQAEEAATWDKLDEYIGEASSRRAEERAHGAARLAALFCSTESTLRTMPDLSDETIEALLDACRGALDARREPEEREQLVRVVGTALAWDLTPTGFAGDFGEALGVAALQAAREEETAGLAVTMFHAVCFAQAIEGYTLKSGPDTRLATIVAKEAAGKALSDVDADLALVRCAVFSAIEEEDKALVCAAIRTRLAKYSDNLNALCVLLRIFALAVEIHGTGDVLTPASIEEFEEASAKLEGGKDKKKELAQIVRTVVSFIRKGDGPWQSLTLQSGHRADSIEVPLETFVDLALMESLRAVTGDLSSVALRASPLMHALYNIEPENDLETVHTKRARVAEQDRETRYGRMTAAKDRERGRAQARDRKVAM